MPRRRSLRRPRSLATTLALIAAAIVGAAPPAGADCIGPSVTVAPAAAPPVEPGTTLVVSAGDQIRIDGTGFGDDCHDTGPPPEGEGDLGNALDDLTIALIQADGADAPIEVVVAEGNAQPWGGGGPDAVEPYSWSVVVTVPSPDTGLRNGALEVSVRADGAEVALSPPPSLEYRASEAVVLAPEIVTFGPTPQPEPTAAPSPTADTSPTIVEPTATPPTVTAVDAPEDPSSTGNARADTTAGWIMVVGITSLAVLVAAAVVALARRRSRSI